METTERAAVGGRASNNPTGKNGTSGGRPSNWGRGPVFEGNKVFTTGQVARICTVAPRTVSKWFDSGKLKGYRIPGSEDRRIPREQLVRFLKEHGMPLGELEEAVETRVLLVGADEQLAGRLAALLTEADGFKLMSADSTFAAGLLVRATRPRAVVIDAYVGRHVLLDMARHVRADEADRPDKTLLVAVVGEDFTDEAALGKVGFDRHFTRPFDPALLAEVIDAGREG